MAYEKYIECMVFDYGSTNRTDYRDGEISPSIKTVYQPKPSPARVKYPPLGDTHTQTEWKDAKVPPFNLFHKPKDIVRTNPRDVQETYMNEEKDTDSEKEEVRKTRPRLVMTPAVSMDDIEDPRTRQILCTETYTSATGRLMRETLPSRVNVKAPLPAIPLLGDADPFALPKMRPPLVSREWRMETLSWDRRQLRLDYDQTKEFWLGREPTKCIKCDDAALIRTQRKMLRK